MTHEEAIKNGWQLAPNIIHESGGATYVKCDKHGFNTWATLEHITKWYNSLTPSSGR